MIERTAKMKFLCFMLFYSFFLSNLYVDRVSSISGYTLTPSQSLKDGQSLTSQSETFELGFFSPSNSKSRYLGIWYKKIPLRTIVWVANRDSPLNDSSGVFMISSTGNFVILNPTNHVVWSTNSSKTAANPIAEFLESGNLVLRDNKSDGYIWQSFDHPTDTLLPGMKLGWDLRTGLNRYLTSWKSTDDPSTGDYTFGIELNEYPEPVMKYGSRNYYRSGPWNGIRNSGSPELRNNVVFINTVVHNKTDVYYSYQLVNQAVTARLIVKQTGSDGQINRLTWVNQRQNWFLQAPIPVDRCDTYGLCGAGATCNINDVPVCQCLKGFKPESAYDYNEMDWSRGCQHATPLNCNKGDGFMKFKELKLPDTAHTWLNTSTNLEECRSKCLKNCSCMAYANSDIRGYGSGCAMWFGELIDIRKLLGAGQDLYIRMAASELVADASKENGTGSGTKKPLVIITISVILAIFLLGSGVCFIFREKIIQKVRKVSSGDRAHKEGSQDSLFCEVFTDGKRDYQGEKNDDLDPNLFDMDTIVKATYNFSDISLLGQGGFGCVYKGTLEDGKEIAVKRLSKNSGQGLEEFKNEVMLIARLQHRNLVRLLGLCAEGEEKILVYEYMENKSLDAFLFDKTLSHTLDWPRRFNIIVGISRGLLYLHQDSRFRIIHRDLKTSNVLLDVEMNPKISDFGMARIFGGDDAETETKRVVGTYGYMSPEYAMDGIFSVRSDVFSFGVLVLEIISGKKNRGFFSSSEQLNLLGYAWKLWKEGKALQLIDETMKDSCLPNEALRCIHIGLLCVQENAKDRPTMPSVVLMLSTDTTKLQQPKQPGFSFGKSYLEINSSSTSKQGSCSANDVTCTNIEAR